MDQMTDEQLVTMLQTGDDPWGIIFGTLYDRYRTVIRRRAHTDHARAPRISLADWLSHHMEHFWEAVRKFDVDNPGGVPFGYYVNYKLAKRAFDLVRNRLYNEVRNEATRCVAKLELKLESLDAPDGSERRLREHEPDAHTTLERTQPLQRLDLYRYIRDRSHEGAQFLLLVAAGYTYSEIARQLGRSGTRASMVNWGKRTAERLRRYALDYYDRTGNVEMLRSLVAPPHPAHTG